MPPDDALTVAHEAKGMASGAMQAVASDQKLTDLRFKNMADVQEEIKNLIAATDNKIESNTTALYLKIDALNSKIDDLSARYDAKFWALALIIIASLIGGLITLFARGR